MKHQIKNVCDWKLNIMYGGGKPQWTVLQHNGPIFPPPYVPHKVPVIINGNEVEVNISMDFYWKYINYGVNGTEQNNNAPSWGASPSQTLSFHDSILAWKSDRGITLPSNFDDYDSFAWAIQTNIKKYGKKARPFYDDVINEKLVKVLEAPIKNLLGESIKLTIIAPWQ